MAFKLNPSDIETFECAVNDAIETGVLSDADLDAAAGGGIMDYLGGIVDAVLGNGGDTEQETTQQGAQIVVCGNVTVTND